MPRADAPADPSPTDIAALRELAAQLAHDAGAIAFEGRRRDEAVDLGSITKSSRTDIVTRFDRAAEASIVERLRRERPRDAIVGEEGTDHPGTSGYAWYIDPIDGTTNFVYDLPSWCCSVGVAHHDRMVAGAVFVPALGELYTAGAGQGATLDGRRLAVRDEVELGRALVATGFSYDARRRRAQAAVVASLIGDVRDIRRSGSAAVDLCMLAAGRVDVYYEAGLNSWDMAAGELIAREAGAVTSDFGGGPARPAEMLAAVPALHAAFVALLNRA
jgi:myo-inositol-1(or 4)-monophosphatase